MIDSIVSNTFIVSSLHLFMGFLQFFLAALILLSNYKHRANKAISQLFVLFGVLSLAVGARLSALTLQESLPWIYLQIALLYTIGPSTFLTSLIILQPKASHKPWLRWPAIVAIAFPIISVLLDITGISQALFNTALMIAPPQASEFIPGLGSASVYVTGIARSISVGNLFLFAILGLLYPTLYTIITDWRKGPENRRTAIILFVAMLISSVSVPVLQNVLPPTISEFISSLAYVIGFAYIGMKGIDTRINITGIPNQLRNFSMFYKLLVVTAGVVLPSIVVIGILSVTFMQYSLINTTGADHELLAKAQARFIGSEIEKIIYSLETISSAPLTSSLLQQRESEYSELTPDAIRAAVRQTDINWRRPEIVDHVINAERNAPLTNFLASNPNHSAFILVDRYGGLITASYQTTKYDQSNQDWFQHVLESGQPYFGLPVIDEFSGQSAFPVAIPIFRQEQLGQMDSVLVTFYLTEALAAHLPGQAIHGSGGTDIFTLNGEWIPIEHEELHETPNLNWTLLTLFPNQQWQILHYGNEDSVVAWAEVPDDGKTPSLNWAAVSHTPIKQVLSSISIARWGTIIIILIIIIGSILLTTIFARFITVPLTVLTEAAERITAGETNVQAEIYGEDELGTLGKTFNSMTNELNNLVTNLERTVLERTHALERRTNQMAASAVIAREAAEIREVNELLTRATQLIAEHFDYYHTGIFLIDDRNEYAVLQTASSEGGQRMLARGHKLQVGKVGVVGYAAGTGEPRIAQDVGADVIYYDNPDMPDTRSELALPLKVRDRVIGVLDVQSKQANAFTREDLQVLQGMSDQIALAIESARLLQGSQQALQELESLYGGQVLHAWRQRLAGKDINYAYNPIGIAQINQQSTLAASDDQQSNMLTKDITFRGQSIGAIELLRDKIDGTWSEDEQALVEEILEQTALALENARLVDQIRLRGDQIELLQQITALSASNLKEDEILQIVAEKLQTGMDLLHCGIVIFDDERKIGYLKVNVSAPNAPFADIAIGTPLPIEGNLLTEDIIRTQKPATIYDVRTNPRAVAMREILEQRGTFSIVIFPLITRGEVIGTIGLDIADPERRLDDEDLNLLNQISAQVSAAIDGARLFAAEQRGRASADAMLEITQIASSSLELQEVLKELSQRSAQALDAYRCTVFLVDPTTAELMPIMSQFAKEQQTDERQWEALKAMGGEKIEAISLVKQAFEQRQPIQVNTPEQFSQIPSRWTAAFKQATILLVPMISQDKSIGLMVFDHIDKDKIFNSEQIALGRTIAGQVATTVENATLYNQTVRRANRERLVAEITSKVRASNDPQEILQTAVSELRQVLNSKTSQVRIDIKNPSNGHAKDEHTDIS